jgi:hypothetical protein
MARRLSQYYDRYQTTTNVTLPRTSVTLPTTSRPTVTSRRDEARQETTSTRPTVTSRRDEAIRSTPTTPKLTFQDLLTTGSTSNMIRDTLNMPDRDTILSPGGNRMSVTQGEIDRVTQLRDQQPTITSRRDEAIVEALTTRSTTPYTGPSEARYLEPTRYQTTTGNTASQAQVDAWNRFARTPEGYLDVRLGRDVGGVGTPSELRAGGWYGVSSAIFSGPTTSTLEAGNAAVQATATTITEFGVAPSFLTPYVKSGLGLSDQDMIDAGYILDPTGNWVRGDFASPGATSAGIGTGTGTGTGRRGSTRRTANPNSPYSGLWGLTHWRIS